MSYVQGCNRDQIILFPPIIDDYITEDNQVRVIDAFVDNLTIDLFKYSTTQLTGRPPYDPKTLLKLYIYGYLNGIKSSRKLERETHRNVEVMWLLEKLIPDHKTIANFRKDNKEAIRQVFKDFTLLCKNLELFGCELIAVDGSKFAAVNSKKRTFTKDSLQKRLERIEKHIEEYLDELDKNDEEEANIEKPGKKELQEKIKSLKKKQNEYQKLQEQLEKSEDTQISLTDSDSRMMKTAGGGKDVCYNVQIAVDDKYNLIVDYEVTNHENDTSELSNMSIKAKEMLGVKTLEVLADKGYYSNMEIKKCADHGIIPYVPKPDSNVGKCLFNKEQFQYNREKDVYICPSGEELRYRKNRKVKDGQIKLKIYQGKTCAGCCLKTQCTTNKQGRMIERWEHEEIMEEMGRRVKTNQEKYKKRQCTVEPVFGTIKRYFNQGYMLLKGIPKVNAEFGLSALAYNIKRVINIVGSKKLIEVMA